MTLLRLALICALGLLLVAPPAAAGGGWWSSLDVDRSTVAPGQQVKVKSFLLFRSVAAAEEARASGRYYVHLLRGFDYSVLEPAMREAEPRNWWTLGGAEAIQIAPATVGITDSNSGWAHATFTMPEVEPGTYHVMLCDATCTQPLANVVPAARFKVVADPATTQLTRRAGRQDERMGRLAGRVSEALSDAYSARSTAEDTELEIEQLQRRIASLTAEVRRPEPVTPWSYAGWLLTATLAGALVLLIYRRRRPVRWHPSDEELRELLASEREHQPR